jgi:hypothetical protein
VLFAFLAAAENLLLKGRVRLDLPIKPALIPEFVWLVLPERVMPPESELTFPEFCCLLCCSSQEGQT